MSDDQSDDVLQTNIRTLYIRSHKLLRMFSYCTVYVKKELFRSYCSSLYCCALWSDYRKATYRKLTVAFNNIHRGLLGLPWRCNDNDNDNENILFNITMDCRKYNVNEMQYL